MLVRALSTLHCIGVDPEPIAGLDRGTNLASSVTIT